MNATALYAKASPDFAEKLAESTALLKRAAAEFSPLTQASSLGAEDVVITHLLSETGVNSDIFVLDTGMLHAQTLALVGRIEERYGCKIDAFRPDPDVAAAFVENFGEQAMYKSVALRKQCCGIRKTEPLGRALVGKNGWLTGLRREQSSARSEVEFIEHESERAKINPLARWTAGDVWHYIALHSIPYNPLHDEFFPSIGCAPCTRAVTLGEDIRSGRWWWEQESAKECGLHVAADGTHEAQEPAALEPASSLLPNRTSSIVPIREISA